ncbi:hypothetical protein [Rhizobium sp. BK538]|uniref:hypothetical protein n=1 Tax=Rhizobium sp. BK538 TaxID=2586984 RepID=UPI00160C9913|nr:hypothetical protein [Rhizobium sp. BK538]MBB4171597.1 hypothetical protein [Rhizobium sp. BK538]
MVLVIANPLRLGALVVLGVDGEEVGDSQTLMRAGALVSGDNGHIALPDTIRRLEDGSSVVSRKPVSRFHADPISQRRYIMNAICLLQEVNQNLYCGLAYGHVWVLGEQRFAAIVVIFREALRLGVAALDYTSDYAVDDKGGVWVMEIVIADPLAPHRARFRCRRLW